jgi:flagellin
MSLRINTNVAALNAYNNLSVNQAKQGMAFEQLSSGLRINKAADDAAGLSIANGLTSQINGLTQATSNAQDGINVAQIADGSLSTVQTILQRMRSLVVQAGNAGTMDQSSLDAITAEVGTLNTQLGNISSQTKFGGKNLLDGSYNFNFQVGANGGETIALNLSTADVKAATLGTSSLTIASTVSGTYDPSSDLTAIDAAIGTVNTARSTIGAVQNQLNYTVTNLQTAITNVTASRSNLTDADLATQVTNMTQAQILTSAATSVLAQANSAPQAILKLLQ